MLLVQLPRKLMKPGWHYRDSNIFAVLRCYQRLTIPLFLTSAANSSAYLSAQFRVNSKWHVVACSVASCIKCGGTAIRFLFFPLEAMVPHLRNPGCVLCHGVPARLRAPMGFRAQSHAAGRLWTPVPGDGSGPACEPGSLEQQLCAVRHWQSAQCLEGERALLLEPFVAVAP